MVNFFENISFFVYMKIRSCKILLYIYIYEIINMLGNVYVRNLMTLKSVEKIKKCLWFVYI